MIALPLMVLAWAWVPVFATMLFSRHVTWSGHELVQMEVLGFAYAFTVAGTVTGFVALTTIGEWRRAFGFVLAGTMFVGASMPALRWIIFHLAGRNVGWGQWTWDESLERIGPCVAVGLMMALVVSVLVVAARLSLRRLAPWQLGIIVALAVTILGLWGFPLLISFSVDRAIPYLRWNYGYRYDEALQGAAIGSGPGGLAGAILVSVLTRWLGTTKASMMSVRREDSPSNPTNGPGHEDSTP